MAAGASPALNMSQNDTISAPSTQEAFDHQCCKKYHARAVCPPRRGRSANSPNTFLTSSTSNSRVEPLVHVLSLTVNQFCHDFDGGRPRSPVGDGTLASLKRVMSGSRFALNVGAKLFVLCPHVNCLRRGSPLSQLHQLPLQGLCLPPAHLQPAVKNWRPCKERNETPAGWDTSLPLHKAPRNQHTRDMSFF